MTEEEYIQDAFNKLWGGCDPAVEQNPRRYCLGFYRAGWEARASAGKIIADQVLTADQERIQNQMCDAHYAQGVAYSAYQASHVALLSTHGMTPEQAAIAMRELIVETLRVAAMNDKSRAEAKG